LKEIWRNMIYDMWEFMASQPISEIKTLPKEAEVSSQEKERLVKMLLAVLNDKAARGRLIIKRTDDSEDWEGIDNQTVEVL